MRAHCRGDRSDLEHHESLTSVGIELLGQLKTQISIDPDRSEKTRIAQGWSGYIWTSSAWQLYHMGLCQSLQRRRKDQTMWQPKVLVEFHLKFKYCIILLKWSIQNIETTLWRQGVHYLHCYISCACVCVSEPVNHSPLLPKKGLCDPFESCMVFTLRL